MGFVAKEPMVCRRRLDYPLYTFPDMNVVLAHALTPKDDGIQNARITALQ